MFFTLFLQHQVSTLRKNSIQPLFHYGLQTLAKLSFTDLNAVLGFNTQTYQSYKVLEEGKECLPSRPNSNCPFYCNSPIIPDDFQTGANIYH